MRDGRCRICGVYTRLGADRRCRGCREGKAATDNGQSYGHFKAGLFEKYGEMEDVPEGMFLTCPVCRKVFIPARYNQIYDSNACAQRAAAKRYYKKRRKDACHRAPVNASKGAEHGANAADQVGRGADEDDPVPQM